MNPPWRIENAGLGDVEKLARALSVELRKGDFLALAGDLGAGKTAFARALIIALHEDNPPSEIPSPTFAIGQSYETARLPVHHFDFYRIESAQEAHELGLDDALAGGVVLAEWPEKMGEDIPGDRLEIAFEDADDPDQRHLQLSGFGSWAARLERFKLINDFLAGTGWGDAGRRFLQGDASTRRYLRLSTKNRRALLMDAPAQPDGPAIRGGKPYSAIAHLAEDVAPFVAIANALRTAGVCTPEIYAQDINAGLLLLEDFGDRVFGREIALGQDMAPLYRGAVDLLVALRQSPPPARLAVSGKQIYELPAFDVEAFTIEVELLPDWYWPALYGEPAGEALRAGFLELWSAAYKRLLVPLGSTQEWGWVLRDYHSPNLICLDGREDCHGPGVIDFQDAMRGPLAYDLASLLQDARLDLPESLEASLFEHYCSACSRNDSGFDKARFGAVYALMGAQRNTKILGIFARLAIRDQKPGYLAHLPRIAGYLTRNLEHPALGELKDWFDQHVPIDRRGGPLNI